MTKTEMLPKASAWTLAAIVLLGVCASSPALAQRDQPGIYLDLDEIRAIANRVRGGRSLQPESWPNGARVAVSISFDVDNDTLSLARNVSPSIGGMSQGEYGARVGLPRVVELMDRHEIPASFFHSGGQSGAQTRDGGCHQGVRPARVRRPRLDSRDQHRPGRRDRARVGDPRPELSHGGDRHAAVGYRAPSWNFSPNTLNIIKGLGFLYDSSLMADDRPYELMQNGAATVSSSSRSSGFSTTRRS